MKYWYIAIGSIIISIIGIFYFGNRMKQLLYTNNFHQLMEALSCLPNKKLILIGIDGRPGSGKTTVAMQLEEALHAESIYLDEFFIPQKQWPKDAKPQFPFFYFRYQEFIDGVKALAAGKPFIYFPAGKPFIYFPYDWENDGLSKQAKVIKPEGIIVVEGVSVLNSELALLYDKKIWVDSDRNSEFAAITQRENEKNLDLWKNIYLPSVDLYCLQRPWERVDIIYAGRGINQ